MSVNKYLRTIRNAGGESIEADIYDVLDAYGVTCQARGHAVKKMMLAGLRGKATEMQDLLEAIQAMQRAVEILQVKEKAKS